MSDYKCIAGMISRHYRADMTLVWNDYQIIIKKGGRMVLEPLSYPLIGLTA